MYNLTIVPFVYFLRTRLKSKIQKISWVFVYFVPNIFLYFYITDFVFNINNILMLILGIILMNYIYENGYIENDVILTQKEKNPNLRIKGKLLDKVRENIRLIFFCRFLIISLVLLLIYLIDRYAFVSFLIISMLLQILYWIYNSNRSIVNLYLILFLSFLRFYGFIIPFVQIEHLYQFVLLSVLLYPLLKFLEFTKQPRYCMPRLSQVIGKVDSFRIVYYIVLVCLLLFLNYMNFISVEYVYIACYYLILRVCVLFLLTKSESVKKEIFKNTKKIYRE